MARPRLDTDDWQGIFWSAGLSDLQGEVFRRRETLKEPVGAIARDRGTTSHAVRSLLAGAWKKLREHPWTDAEIKEVRERLAREDPGEEWVSGLMEIFRTQRSNPPTPHYDNLGRQVAQHQPLLNRDDHLALHRGGSYVPRCPAGEHKRIKDEIDAEARKRAEHGG